MNLKKAFAYLEEVKEHKRCIPFRRFDGSMGRTGQAKEFGLTKGRWPVKSIEFVVGLLKNAQSNAEVRNVIF
jgi:large subunit ribosomal protein L17e